MPVFDKFLGVSRAYEPHALPDGLCVSSLNQRPGRPDLRPWNALGVDAKTKFGPDGNIELYSYNSNISPTASEPSIYRVRTSPTDGFLVGSNSYLSFMQGFDDANAQQNVYITGLGKPKFSIASGSEWTNIASFKDIGIPAPTIAPSFEITSPGTSGTGEVIFFFFTLLVKGRESSAGPITGPIVTSFDDAVLGFTFPPYVDVSGLDNNAYSPTGEEYTLRVYRTQAGFSSASFFRWFDIIVSWDRVHTRLDPPAGVMDPPIIFTSGVTIPLGAGWAGVKPGLEYSTDGWVPPPEDGHHITLMWNGMASMLSKKTVRICEPGVAYAWPKKNSIQLAFDGVAQAVWQQTLVVGTNGKPYAIQGQDPGALSYSLIELNASCISHRSMVSVGHGVVWSSPSGLAYVGDRGPGIITAGIIPPEVWVREFYPSTIVGAAVGSFYFAFYYTGAERRGFCIDTLNPAAGIMPLSTGYRAAYTDHNNELMFVLDSASQINVWDARDTPMQVTARSKEWHSDAPQTFQALEVIGTGPADVKIIADGVTIMSRSCAPGKYHRFKPKAASRWQLEVSTSQNVQAVILGRIDAYGNLVP